MKEKYNLKSIIVSLVVSVIGIVIIPLDFYLLKSTINLGISIGCSLISSSVVAILTTVFVEKQHPNPLDEWKIDKIYSTRAEKNAESDPKLKKVKDHLDVVAFGLKSFRSKQSKTVETLLRNGVNIRIITMNPDSPFVTQRETEEQEQPGQIQNTIYQLIEWADKLNTEKYKGKIIIKAYSCMTLDFYWRMDDELYVGPYWYGISSQQTITYKFIKGGRGFDHYTDYFDSLWDNIDLTCTLTQYKEFRYFKNKKKK